jgi:hypothetical protein
VIREYVNAQQVMHFVDRATPDTFDTDRALVVGVHARRLYAYRKQKWITRETAEKLLDAFDLGYLLYTGDIEIRQDGIGESNESAKRKAQQRNKQLSEELQYWKARAKRLENNPPSPPNCTCKDNVKEFDNLIVCW